MVSFAELVTGGVRQLEHDDVGVLAGALADDGFVQYARELGHIWDETEMLHILYAGTDASGVRTPEY